MLIENKKRRLGVAALWYLEVIFQEVLIPMTTSTLFEKTHQLSHRDQKCMLMSSLRAQGTEEN